MNRLATPKQLWAIFVISGYDVRDSQLSLEEASDIIKRLKQKEEVDFSKIPNAVLKKKVAPRVDFDAVEIWNDALEKGKIALQAATPTPMVVQQHANMADDSSPVVKEWYVEGGVCGFAWVDIHLSNTETRQFINQLKKKGIVGEGYNHPLRKGYRGGYSYWVSAGGQSMERKEAFARAMAASLREHNIECHAGSRMD